MIICVCKKVSDRDIIKLLITGTPIEQIREILQVGVQCKKCIPTFNQLCNINEREN